MIDFSNKKIAILGFGIEGQNLADFLLQKQAKIAVFDQKEEGELKSIKGFKNKGIDFVLGKDYLKEGLKEFDFIFRSPGFRLDLSSIKEAEKRGAVVSSSTKLFFDLCPGKIIGVTGSKGKGTTATLIYKILKEDGQDVYLGGNIGTPMLSLLSGLRLTSWVVLELSSFQLEDLEKSPHLSVVLFITPEHLDYHQSFKNYLQAKTSIVSYQGKKDLAVFNADDKNSLSFVDLTLAQKFYFSKFKETKGAYVKKGKIFLLDKLLGEVKDLKLIGRHNWENVCAASMAAFLAGAKLPSIKKAVFSFTGLEHRLEKVGVFKGISFYNDSFSTIPEATTAAILSFQKPITLIAGGSEKDSDYTQLGKEISKSSVKTLILIGQTANKIKEVSLKAGFKGKFIKGSNKMKEIVDLSFKEAKKGEIVLLSPGCASFGLFKNYKDRGNQFKKYVQTL